MGKLTKKSISENGAALRVMRFGQDRQDFLNAVLAECSLGKSDNYDTIKPGIRRGVDEGCYPAWFDDVPRHTVMANVISMRQDGTMRFAVSRYLSGRPQIVKMQKPARPAALAL